MFYWLLECRTREEILEVLRLLAELYRYMDEAIGPNYSYQE
jgi:hypothetical protein